MLVDVDVLTLVPVPVTRIFTNQTEKVVEEDRLDIDKVFKAPVVKVVFVVKPLGVTGLLAVQL